MSSEERNFMHICLEESSHDPKSQAIKISSWKSSYLFMHLYKHSYKFCFHSYNFFPGKYVRRTSQVSGNRQALLIDTVLPHRVWSNRESVKKTDQVKQTTEAQNCDVNRATLKSRREKPSLGRHFPDFCIEHGCHSLEGELGESLCSSTWPQPCWTAQLCWCILSTFPHLHL